MNIKQKTITVTILKPMVENKTTRSIFDPKDNKIIKHRKYQNKSCILQNKTQLKYKELR